MAKPKTNALWTVLLLATGFSIFTLWIEARTSAAGDIDPWKSVYFSEGKTPQEQKAFEQFLDHKDKNGEYVWRKMFRACQPLDARQLKDFFRVRRTGADQDRFEISVGIYRNDQYETAYVEVIVGKSVKPTKRRTSGEPEPAERYF